MKRKQRLLKMLCSMIMVSVFFCTNSLMVSASTATNEELKVSVTTNKAEYELAEEIELIVEIENIGRNEVLDVSVDSAMPADYAIGQENFLPKRYEKIGVNEVAKIVIPCIKVSSDSQGGNIVNPSPMNTPSAIPNDSVGNASSELGSTKSESVVDTIIKSPITGDSVGLVLLVFSVSLGGIILGAKTRKGKRILSIILCITIVSSASGVEAFAQVDAQTNRRSISVNHNVKIDGIEKEFTISVDYEYNGTENDDIIDKLEGEISIEDVDAEGVIQTEAESIQLKGNIACEETIGEVLCETYSEVNNEKVRRHVNGTTEWYTDSIDLDIGTNYVTITASTEAGQVLTREIRVIRNSTYINGADDVVAFDVTDTNELEEVKQIYDQILSYWVNDFGTENTDDDECCLAVYETSPLYQYISEGVIRENDVIFIPENEYFLAGLTMIYISHDDVCDESVENYDASTCEVIRTKNASLMDLFDGDISLNMTEFDSENPVAFIYVPQGADLAIGDETPVLFRSTSRAADDGDEFFNLGSRDDVTRAGFQFQNLVKFLPTVDMSQIDSGKIQLTFPNVVLFDKDGNKATSEDRVVADGNITMSNIRPTVGLEWHPTLANPLPKQFISTLDYTQTESLKITLGGDIANLEDLAKICNESFDNKQDLILGIKASGISTKDTVFLGAVGLQVGTPVTVGSLKTVANKSFATTFNPILVIAFVLDMEGNINVNLSIEYKQTSYIKKGFNIQQDNFIGAYGPPQTTSTEGIECDRITDIPLVPDYTVNTYDIKQKSKTEAGNPEQIHSLLFEGKAEAYVGAGVGVGIMMCGIMPAMVKGSIGPYVLVDGYGQIVVSNYEHPNTIKFRDAYWEYSANAEFQLKMKARARLDVNLKAETVLGSPALKYKKNIGELELFSAGASTVSMDGRIYATDLDDNVGNNQPIANAVVQLKKNATLLEDEDRIYTATTDSSGYYKLRGMSTTSSGLTNTGLYTLTVTKDGYEQYVNDSFKVVTSTSGHTSVADYFSKKYDYYLDSSVKTSSISGVVTKADDDTDITNNEPLKNAQITISKTDSSTFDTDSYEAKTDELGGYMISNLPMGRYKIKVTKSGYLDAESTIIVSENDTTFFNVAMEAIHANNYGLGIASGHIIDALTGHMVTKPLNIYVYKGYNTDSGEIIKQFNTNPDGTYDVELEAGNYTMIVKDESSVPQYKEGICNIKVLGGKIVNEQNCSITPLLETDEIRIVLTWGAAPRDLDSHLTCEEYHVWYADKNAYDYNSDDIVHIANLDVDDTTSYGPETTTIYKVEDEIFRFSVHNYSGRNSYSSMDLANSGACVKVYSGDSDTIQTYYVPNQEGTLWEVFEYNAIEHKITPINTMTYQRNPSVIGQAQSVDMVTFMIDSEDESDYEWWEKEE